MSGIRFACAILLLTSATYGAAPKLSAVQPPGGRSGTTNAVTALGSISAWPAEMWCNHPGINFKAEKKKGEFSVVIEPDVPAGPHLVRLHSKDGASDTRLFVVGKFPELSETEDNGNLSLAHSITNLPTVINGVLAKTGDTDFFRFSLKRGQAISVAMDCYSLRSTVDPFLRLHDPRGYEVELASDTHNLDPFLHYRAKEAGNYTLQVYAVAHKAATTVAFTGNSTAVYRLTVATDGATNPGRALVADADEKRDGEKVQIIKVPGTLAGVIGEPGEIDRYQFAAKKGEQFTLRVESHRLGYPMDPVMVINRPGGKLLRETDDTKPYRDPEYLVKATDGDYTVEVRDRFGRGGADFRYRLVVEKPEPDVAVTIDKEIIVFEADKTTAVKLKLARKNGHKADLRVVFNDLPKGVGIVDPKIPGKAKDVTVKLVTKKDAPAASEPVRILVVEDTKAGAIIRNTKRSFVTGDSRGDYLLNETEWLWQTVKPAAKKAAEKKKEPAAKKK
jgi:hypothetical protein